jgi:hypothetical protein
MSLMSSVGLVALDEVPAEVAEGDDVDELGQRTQFFLQRLMCLSWMGAGSNLQEDHK